MPSVSSNQNIKTVQLIAVRILFICLISFQALFKFTSVSILKGKVWYFNQFIHFA